MVSDDGLVARNGVDPDVDVESTSDVTDCQTAEDFYSFQEWGEKQAAVFIHPMK